MFFLPAVLFSAFLLPSPRVVGRPFLARRTPLRLPHTALTSPATQQWVQRPHAARGEHQRRDTSTTNTTISTTTTAAATVTAIVSVCQSAGFLSPPPAFNACCCILTALVHVCVCVCVCGYGWVCSSWLPMKCFGVVQQQHLKDAHAKVCCAF